VPASSTDLANAISFIDVSSHGFVTAAAASAADAADAVRIQGNRAPTRQFLATLKTGSDHRHPYTDHVRSGKR